VSIKRVLVTGGAGFIGSNVARLLCDEGLSVTVLDNLSYGRRELVDPRCRFIHGDLADRDQLREAMRDAEAVMHFAASSIIARSFSDPMEYVRNNVLNGANLLESMREAGVKHIVYSSSASVYGEPVHIPINEDDPKQPIQLYGATKLAFETILQGYYHAFGINSVSLRYFNAYGPADLQEPVTRAVPRWIRAALTDEPIVLYWRGEQCRDYVFVEDIAAAHIRVLGLKGLRVYNIGDGEGILMKDVVATLQELFPKPLRVVEEGERTGDPARLVADISRIVSEVGWRPQTKLRDGLARTIPFYEKTRAIWSH
jgi:UDP-glucose 4-epimerase